MEPLVVLLGMSQALFRVAGSPRYGAGPAS
jgi:hypothetical protein